MASFLGGKLELHTHALGHGLRRFVHLRAANKGQTGKAVHTGIVAVPILPLLAQIQRVQQGAAGLAQFLVAQGAEIGHRQSKLWRLGQKEIADGGVGQPREVFQLLERGLGLAGQPQGPLAKARRQIFVVQTRPLRRPAQYRDGSRYRSHAATSSGKAMPETSSWPDISLGSRRSRALANS